MAFKNDKKGKFYKNNFSKKNTVKKVKPTEKYNTPSYVLKKIEDCVEVALTANKTALIAGKIYEASKYIKELEKLEEMGIYKGKTKSKDYTATLIHRKDKILIDGIKRAYAAGETKEQIMENNKYFSDEVKDFVDTLE